MSAVDSNTTDPVVVVLSDLHMGAGREPQTGRFSRLEDFFHDRELASFVDHLCAEPDRSGRSVRLVLNGDVFDFITVADVPDDPSVAGAGVRLTSAERKFGLPPTASATVWKLDRIVEGHPEVFAAMGRLLAAGHELVVLAGNHDPELFFGPVQERVVVHLADAAGEPVHALRDRVRFSPWFWYEPGRLYVEHGHQFDPSNVLNHLLCPLHVRRDGRSEIDLPLGSLFVRYLHNGLKRSNPYMRNFVSLDDYLTFLGSQDMLRTARQAWRNAGFMLRALRATPLRSRRHASWQRHCSTRDALASDDISTEELAQLEALWPVESGRTKGRLLRTLVAPALRQVGVGVVVLVVTLYLWALVLNLILAVPWLAEGPFAKASWLALLAVVTFAGVALGMRSLGRLLKTRGDATFQSLAPHAERIARILDVPFVTMGHTHLADRRELPSGALFINTGTWTAIHGPWDRIQPHGRQFTFARLDGEGFHLRRWDHGTSDEVEVALFEDRRDPLLRRLLPRTKDVAQRRKLPRE